MSVALLAMFVLMALSAVLTGKVCKWLDDKIERPTRWQDGIAFLALIFSFFGWQLVLIVYIVTQLKGVSWPL